MVGISNLTVARQELGNWWVCWSKGESVQALGEGNGERAVGVLECWSVEARMLVDGEAALWVGHHSGEKERALTYTTTLSK